METAKKISIPNAFARTLTSSHYYNPVLRYDFTLRFRFIAGMKSQEPPREYSGTIVDKTIRAIETYEGTAFAYRLTVQEPNGRSFRVVVPESTYNAASIGMSIVRDSRGLRVSPRQPASK